MKVVGLANVRVLLKLKGHANFLAKICLIYFQDYMHL